MWRPLIGQTYQFVPGRVNCGQKIFWITEIASNCFTISVKITEHPSRWRTISLMQQTCKFFKRENKLLSDSNGQLYVSHPATPSSVLLALLEALDIPWLRQFKRCVRFVVKPRMQLILPFCHLKQCTFLWAPLCWPIKFLFDAFAFTWWKRRAKLSSLSKAYFVCHCDGWRRRAFSLSPVTTFCKTKSYFWPIDTVYDSQKVVGWNQKISAAAWRSYSENRFVSNTPSFFLLYLIYFLWLPQRFPTTIPRLYDNRYCGSIIIILLAKRFD